MKKDWYPTQDAKRAAFLENFVANMDKACGLLHVSTSTYADAIASARAWLDAYSQRQEAQKNLEAATVIFQRQAAATDTTMRTAARQIKSLINLPAEVLKMLELVGSSDAATTRVAAQAPRLSATVELGTVVLKYKKLGHQGLLLYSCCTGENASTMLGTYDMARIEDTRPNRVAAQPERRQYYAIYKDRDQPTGGQSATISVVVADMPVAALAR